MGSVLTAAAAAPALAAAYLLTLLVGAARSRGRRALDEPAASATLRFLILVPAHDEEDVIGATLAAVAALPSPPEAPQVVVVADHCHDRTATVAAAHGARVLERTEGAPGKGAALQWALGALTGRDDYDVLLVLDADCIPSRNLLEAVAQRMHAGARVVQTDYSVSNADASAASALRHAAFLLSNTVGPMGRDALGFSAGLRGTGMAFRRDVIERHGWLTSTLVEDHEQHCRLVADGERVAFAAEAGVRSPMPTSLRASRSQQLRWESGRWPLLRRWGVPLLASAVRERDIVRAEVAVSMLIPPQSLLLAGSLTVFWAAVALDAAPARRLAGTSLFAQALFVLGALRVAHAPPVTYRALVYAPILIAQKLCIIVRLAAGGTPRTFVRTPRELGRGFERAVVAVDPGE